MPKTVTLETLWCAVQKQKDNPSYDFIQKSIQIWCDLLLEYFPVTEQEVEAFLNSDLHIVTSRIRISFNGDAFMNNPTELELLIKIGTVKELHKQGHISEKQKNAVINLMNKKYREVVAGDQSRSLLQG